MVFSLSFQLRCSQKLNRQVCVLRRPCSPAMGVPPQPQKGAQKKEERKRTLPASSSKEGRPKENKREPASSTQEGQPKENKREPASSTQEGQPKENKREPASSTQERGPKESKREPLPKLEPAAAEYFRRAHETLKSGFDSDEEKALFVSNVLVEAEAVALPLALDTAGSLLLQALLPSASAPSLSRLLRAFLPALRLAACHPCGAHILEAALLRAPVLISEGAEDAEELEDQVLELARAMQEELPTFAQDIHASFVVRTLLQVLGGVRVRSDGGRGLPGSGSSFSRAKKAKLESDGPSEFEVPETFQSLLGEFKGSFQEHIPSFITNKYFSLCLQVALEVLHRKLPADCSELCHSMIGYLSSRNVSPGQRLIAFTMTHRRTLERPEYHHLVGKPKTKSPVWVHFGLPADESDRLVVHNIAICKICLHSVSVKGGNTTNLTSHLKLHHPQKFKELPSSSAGISDHSCNNADDPPAAAAAAVSTSEPAKTTAEIPRKRQKTLLDFQPLSFETPRSCSQAITEYLATCMQSYNIVDHPKFIQMVNTLNPRYQLPSRKYFATKGVPTLYNDTVEKMRREIGRVKESELVITTDCWTSVGGTPFLAVTVHFISDEWKLINAFLGCKHFLKDHTSDNLCEMLADTLSEWDIDVKNIFCSTTDDNGAILKAVRQLGLEYISCFAQNINTGVGRALNLTPLRRAIVRLKSLQNTICHSWKMRRDLGKAQELLQMEKVSLPSACPTKWWSVLKLCRRFLENQLPVCKMLMDYPSKKHLMLEGCDVSAVQDFVSAATLLEDITTTLSGSSCVTASSVLPLYRQIKKRLQPEEGDSTLLQDIKQEILGALSEKYENGPMVTTLGLASLCDPRFRLRFLESPEAIRQEAIQKMADLHAGSLSEEPDTQPDTPKKEGLAKIFDLEEEEDLSGDGFEPLSVLKAEKELKGYMAMPRVNFDDSPLMWWKTNEAFFPMLKVLARRFLAIPGTSVSSESVFSTAGNVLQKQKSSLLPENAEMQIFLAKNINFV
ncbi:nucleolar protein 9 isoform X1 [Podarcis raffonei]|uniref:nucleolar protein 9 isoform X1 n=3 Tax=Podarcis raffonei TaxID=65483 RepID=UPI0023293930|nr:nucleolar protein 9 isoform X1 [Podarcis raffonei]